MFRDARTVSLIAATLVATGCGIDWRTDMWYQPSHRAEAMPRPEPADSVAVGGTVPLLDVDDAQDFRNPVPASDASVGHGKWIFNERCACCHGPQGRGGGPVSKFFPPAPDLTYVTIKQRSDGHLFGTVTLGGRAMPSQAEGLTQRDRWDIVNFVRSLQSKTGGAP